MYFFYKLTRLQLYKGLLNSIYGGFICADIQYVDCVSALN